METGSEKAWVKYLELRGEQGALTLQELLLYKTIQNHAMLVWLHKEIENLTQAGEHQEGMIGAIDDTLGQIMNRFGPQLGVQYKGSQTLREALDIRRDVVRRAAQESTDNTFSKMIQEARYGNQDSEEQQAPRSIESSHV